MVKLKRTPRKTKSKDVVITDDSAIVALLGLKNSASKKKKGKVTKTSKGTKIVKTPRPRRATIASTPARKSASKTKKSPRISSTRKNPFKTPKTAKSTGRRRKVAPSSSNIVKRLKQQSTSKKKKSKTEEKKDTEYYVNPNRIKTEVVKKIVVDLTKSATLLSPTATNRSNRNDNILQELLETARKANNAVENEYSKKNNSSNTKSNNGSSPAVKAGHYHRNHHHSAKKQQNKSHTNGNINRGSVSSPTAKRKIVDISSPSSAATDNENTSPLKKTKRVQPNRKNVKRSPGSNGIKGVCNKSKNKSFLSFEDARQIVRRLELSGSKAWWHWSKHYRPDNIPSTPDITYRNKGWAGMKDWLGNNTTKRRAVQGRSFLPFDEARKIVQALGLKNKEEWRLWSRTKRPPTIPSTPQRTYKNDGWQGLSAWLGK